MKFFWALSLFTMVTLCVPAIASDEEGDAATDDTELSLEPSDADGWRFELQPYIWLPADIDGTSTVGGMTVDLKLSLSDIFDKMDEVYSFAGRVETWKGNQWGLIFDGMYTHLGGDADINMGKTNTLTLEQELTGPGGLKTIDISVDKDFAIDFDADLDIEIDQSIVDFALGWRVYNESIGKDHGLWPRLTFDLIGGARYQYLKQEIDVSGTVTTLAASESFGPITIGESKDWVEPMIGGRVAMQINDDLIFAIRGDVSGFGIGSASELTWNFVAGVNILFTPKFELRLGYRIMGIDYGSDTGEDAFGLDITMQGPYIGATWVF